MNNHDGVVTHLEPDILMCEVKWALGSITTSKASGGDEIPAELFKILKDKKTKTNKQTNKILKDAAAKVLQSTCQQILKTQQ